MVKLVILKITLIIFIINKIITLVIIWYQVNKILKIAIW